MDDYGVSTYGERIAAVYDELFPAPDTETTVERLAELAGSGRVLELGIGTGRLSLPLLARGIEVEGIDASEAMVARLRAKPGGDRIPVTIGDFADVAAEGEFALVFVAFNTFFGLLTQEDQVRCFSNVAARLAPGGAFVIGAFVPDLARFDRGQRTSAVQVSVEHVMLEVTRHDLARQRIDSQQVLLSDASGCVSAGEDGARSRSPRPAPTMCRSMSGPGRERA
jgi:SAM-dependent methyltransferase